MDEQDRKRPYTPRKRPMRYADWQERFDRINFRRKHENMNLERACVAEGVSYSTYHAWRKMLGVPANPGRPRKD